MILSFFLKRSVSKFRPRNGRPAFMQGFTVETTFRRSNLSVQVRQNFSKSYPKSAFVIGYQPEDQLRCTSLRSETESARSFRSLKRLEAVRGRPLNERLNTVLELVRRIQLTSWVKGSAIFCVCSLCSAFEGSAGALQFASTDAVRPHSVRQRLHRPAQRNQLTVFLFTLLASAIRIHF